MEVTTAVRRISFCFSNRAGLRTRSKIQSGCLARNGVVWALRENPQNVDEPEQCPSRDLSAEEAVGAQLDALRANNAPWYNHGLQTMYAFAEDVGGLERSRYFGYSKDLYHFDHFMGEFANRFGDIVDHEGYDVLGATDLEGGLREVLVAVRPSSPHGNMSQRRVAVKFRMKVRGIGRNKGCWMTAALVRAEGQESAR